MMNWTRFLGVSLITLSTACGSTLDVGQDGQNGGKSTPGSPALDGTWDITSYGGDDLAPSSVTINGGRLTGTINIVRRDDDGGQCPIKLEFAIEGDSMSGSSTPANGCARRPGTLAGTRTEALPDSDTPWNGTWSIPMDGETREFTISGLSAKSRSGDFLLSIAGGIATASSDDRRLTFSARRR